MLVVMLVLWINAPPKWLKIHLLVYRDLWYQDPKPGFELERAREIFSPPPQTKKNPEDTEKNMNKNMR